MNGDTKQWCSCMWERLLSLCWYWVKLPSTVMVCAYHNSTLPSHIRPKALTFSVNARRNGRGFPASVKISFPWKTTSQYRHLNFTVQPYRQACSTSQNFFPMALRPNAGHGLLILEVCGSHTTTAPQSVGLLWTSDRLVEETSTWQHTTLTTDRHPCLRWDSNLQSQQANGCRPTP